MRNGLMTSSLYPIMYFFALFLSYDSASEINILLISMSFILNSFLLL